MGLNRPVNCLCKPACIHVLSQLIQIADIIGGILRVAQPFHIYSRLIHGKRINLPYGIISFFLCSSQEFFDLHHAGLSEYIGNLYVLPELFRQQGTKSYAAYGRKTQGKQIRGYTYRHIAYYILNYGKDLLLNFIFRRDDLLLHHHGFGKGLFINLARKVHGHLVQL